MHLDFDAHLLSPTRAKLQGKMFGNCVANRIRKVVFVPCALCRLEKRAGDDYIERIIESS